MIHKSQCSLFDLRLLLFGNGVERHFIKYFNCLLKMKAIQLKDLFIIPPRVVVVGRELEGFRTTLSTAVFSLLLGSIRSRALASLGYTFQRSFDDSGTLVRNRSYFLVDVGTIPLAGCIYVIGLIV